jgi:hypothetical protein
MNYKTAQINEIARLIKQQKPEMNRAQRRKHAKKNRKPIMKGVIDAAIKQHAEQLAKKQQSIIQEIADKPESTESVTNE